MKTRESKPLIHSLAGEDLAAICAEMGQPGYRAAQLLHWLYRRQASDWEAMKNMPASLLAALAERFSLNSATVVETSGRAGFTQKILVELPDGERVEEVLIPAADRRTVCVSTQVGCKFRCAFCASGQAGFRRNLEAGEMVGQILIAARELGRRPTHVVFMGIGEPMENYDSVLKSIRIINDEDGLAVGARRITISTCGVIPGIERLAREGLQVELSVSLHAADNSLRSRLMPVNRVYPLISMLGACRAYSEATGRIVTCEYILIKDVNDSPQQANALVHLLGPMKCRVNLIPLSPVEEYEGRPSPPAAARKFMTILMDAGINATMRASKGSPIKAACGQLRAGC